MRRTPRLLSIIGLAAAGCLTLAACSANAGAPAAGGDGLDIVTTTTQVTDFAANVTAGTGATITPLLKPGQSVHGFEATAADLAAIAGADVVIASGYGLETWLDDTLAAAGFGGTLIDASTGFDPAALHDDHADDAADTHDHADHTDDPHDHADHTDDTHDHADHTDDGHDDHAADDGHDHGGAGDPHIWTSPLAAALMTENIAAGLAQADAANADAYRAGGDAYVTKLNALDDWITANVQAVPESERLLVTNHNALSYFTDEYHVTFVGSIMPSWDDNAEPSAAELDALIAAIRASGVRAIFTETQLSDATAQRLASETGVQIFSGDRALYTDALGAEGTPQATYIGATAHNTRMLLESWGRSASDLPAELQGA